MTIQVRLCPLRVLTEALFRSAADQFSPGLYKTGGNEKFVRSALNADYKVPRTDFRSRQLENHPHGSSIKAYAGSLSPGTNTVVKDKEKFDIAGGNIKVKSLHTPCHTQDSICFFLEDSEGKKGVFTG